MTREAKKEVETFLPQGKKTRCHRHAAERMGIRDLNIPCRSCGLSSYEVAENVSRRATGKTRIPG